MKNVEFEDLNATINSLDVGIVVVDENLTVELMNDAFHRIWKTQHQDLKVGDQFRRLIDVNRENGIYDVCDDEWEAYVRTRTDEIKAGNIAPREFDRADGVHMIYSVTNLSNDRRLISYIDNTHQKQRQNELEAAMKVAESAERAKSEFLANMSHEIRTPMNGVMGMAELLATTELDPKQKMFTDVIIKSGAALLTIINDILDFSKIDAGQMELDPAPFNLAESVEDVATLVSSRVAEKDLELIVRVAPELPTMLEGDIGRIRQILTNLVGNAVKFTDNGHVYVNVDGELETSDNENGMAHLTVSVQDTGIGIPPEQCAQVFQKFSQVDTSATRKHEGTGLGLSIASSLVELMGGEIGVESEVGIGSTFWFKISLPINNDEVELQNIPQDVKGARVLIIDDNKVNRSILTEQMKTWNFDSATASSGPEGLEIIRAILAKQVSLDLIILDYQMPGMSGEEVLEAIRNDEALNHLPVLMLTSVDGSQTQKRLNQLGVQGNLIKPTRSALLLETMLQIISKYRATLQSLTPSQEIEAPTPQQESDKPAAMSAAEQVETHAEQSVGTSNPDQIDILVAEDNEVNQIVIRQILEASGYNFEIVENGKLALQYYMAKQPKLILMDVSMPQMNGKEATVAIREFEAENGLKRTPIIGVTAHALTGDKESCFEAGMDDYLSKPVSPSKLAEKAQAWLSSMTSMAKLA